MDDAIVNLAKKAKATAASLANLSSEQKNQAILAMVDALEQNSAAIITANEKDLAAAKEKQLNTAFIDRLQLTPARLQGMIDGLKAIAELPDPVGKTLASWQVESGLQIARVSIPIGVIAIIYESRPNVTADAACLGFKSGNAVILRGGSECAQSNKAIATCLQQGLKAAGITEHAIQYMPTQARSAVSDLLQLDEYIDVIVPRGGKSLIQHIREHSRIPVFSHLDGLCHTYIHSGASLDMAVNIICNAKMRRTGICGATETLLIDEAIAAIFLPKIAKALSKQGCQLRGDKQAQTIDNHITAATDEDWATEYLDAILSIKLVKDCDEAITHIARYGSNHTEAIITDDAEAAKQFQQQVNSAIVMHNCSTQFADGGEFGMGAEIGIATGKLHARGPVGLEQLTTFKYVVKGNGQTRA